MRYTSIACIFFNNSDAEPWEWIEILLEVHSSLSALSLFLYLESISQDNTTDFGECFSLVLMFSSSFPWLLAALEACVLSHVGCPQFPDAQRELYGLKCSLCHRVWAVKNELWVGQVRRTVWCSGGVWQGAAALHITLEGLWSQWPVGRDMSGCDDHIRAQQEELLTGPRPGTGRRELATRRIHSGTGGSPRRDGGLASWGGE